VCRSHAAFALWYLGYPDQGLARNDEALTLAQHIVHPYSLGYALTIAASFHQYRREVRAAQERAEAAIRLAMEQGFPSWMAYASILHAGRWRSKDRRREGSSRSPRLDSLACHGAETNRSYFWRCSPKHMEL